MTREHDGDGHASGLGPGFGRIQRSDYKSKRVEECHCESLGIMVALRGCGQIATGAGRDFRAFSHPAPRLGDSGLGHMFRFLILNPKDIILQFQTCRATEA